MSLNPIGVPDILHFLEQGIEILKRADDDLYARVIPPFERGGIGRHIRHVLDHFAVFWEGVEPGVIDYDDRGRNLSIEQNRLSALAMIESAKTKWMSWLKTHPDLVRTVRVRHNGIWCQSSVGRELQHLVNHTVHHYAFVAVILKIQQRSVPEDFGVAPSTLGFPGPLDDPRGSRP
jgi:uncharacterized damage-inducible protein DinB